MAIANIKESADRLVVSKKAQADAGTAATCDYLANWDAGSTIDITPTRETDQEEKTGKVLATTVRQYERVAGGQLNRAAATPNDLAWAMALALADHTVTASGSGYKHVSQLTSFPDAPPYFTALHRQGGGTSFAGHRHHVGLAINTLTITAAKGQNLGMQLGIVGTGEYTDQVYTETISAADSGSGTVSLVLTHKIHGADRNNASVTVTLSGSAAGRVDDVLVPSGYTDATKTLTVPSTGTAGTHDFRVSYLVADSEAGFTVFSNATAFAPSFWPRTKDIAFVLGGKYASGALTGGITAACEIEDVSVAVDWGIDPIACWRAGSTPVDYSSGLQRGATPSISVAVNRRVADHLLAQMAEPVNGEMPQLSFQLHAKSSAEFATGQPWETKLIIPRLALKERTRAAADGAWQDQVTFEVLQEASGSDPAIYHEVITDMTGFYA